MIHPPDALALQFAVIAGQQRLETAARTGAPACVRCHAGVRHTVDRLTGYLMAACDHCGLVQRVIARRPTEDETGAPLPPRGPQEHLPRGVVMAEVLAALPTQSAEAIEPKALAAQMGRKHGSVGTACIRLHETGQIRKRRQRATVGGRIRTLTLYWRPVR